MSKVLVVDDDKVLSKMVADWLHSEKFTVDVASTGLDARALMNDFHYDAIILDWELPDISGLSVLDEYRKKGGTGLVLMLTGKDEIQHKESGFSTGADDYLTKPFHIRELVLRLQALLRRPHDVFHDHLQVNDLRLHPDTRKVFVGEREVVLLPKEFAVLEHLMRHPGQVFDADMLIERIWKSEADVQTDTVRTCIKRLRQKLDAEGKKSHIETLYGAGYRLSVDNS
jgi:DNA-binding response OmpR family regulator